LPKANPVDGEAKPGDDGAMRKTAWLALLSICACDREARQAENQRLDRCKMTLPILRGEPAEPYRVVQIVEAYSETDLAWYACVEHADAVISTFTQDEVTTTTAGGGPHVIISRSRTRTEAKFIGRAIKFEPG
jgi:hypothetical protein